MFIMPMSAVGFGAHYGVTGYEPAGALMLDGSADYLSWTPASAGNHKTFTISAWVKRSKLGAAQGIIGTAPDGNNFFDIRFDASDRLEVGQYSTSSYDLQYVSTAVFRDTSAWVHLVVVVDTTAGTGNRIKYYINGTAVTVFTTSSEPSVNLDTDFLATNKIILGGRSDNGTLNLPFSGYLADVIVLDGTATTDCSEFGETDSDTGIWVPKDPSDISSFGTNGFWLGFKNPSEDADGVGKDNSTDTIRELHSTGTVIGDMTDHGGIAAGFNNSTGANTVSASKATPLDASGGGTTPPSIYYYVGKNWGSTKTLTGCTVYGATNLYGFRHISGAVNIQLIGHSSDAPASGTVLYTSGDISGAAGQSHHIPTASITTTTAYQYHWVGIRVKDSGMPSLYISEVDFYTDGDEVPNSFTPTSMGANNIAVDGPANSTTAETTLYPSWNPLEVPSNSNITYSNQNLTIVNTSSTAENTALAIPFPTSGKTYVEMILDARSSSSTAPAFGLIAKPSAAFSTGDDVWLVPDSASGDEYDLYVDDSLVTEDYMTIAVGSVIQICYDADSGKVWFGDDNTFVGAPASGTGQAGTLTVSGVTYYLAVRLRNNAKVTIKQEANFSHTPPSGFSALTSTVTGVGNYATWNPLSDDGGGVALSDGNLNANRTGDPGTIQATIALPESGKWAWQSTIDEQDVAFHGIMGYDQLGTAFGGSPAGNTGYVACMIYHSTQGSELNKETSNVSTGLTDFVATDTIEILVDVDSATMDVKRNGSAHGSQITGIAIQKPWIPFIGSGQQMDYGATDFGQNGYTPSDSTYKTLHTGNMPEPAVANYEDEYYIEAGISHTNGSTTAVTLPKTVAGGAAVIIKRTDSTGNWYMANTVRGTNKFFVLNTASAEDTSTWSDQNLTGTTLTLPSSLASGTYMIQVMYVGSFCQIKSFTGDATNGTFAFDSALDSAPGMMFILNSADTNSQTIFHSGVGATTILQMDNTAVASDFTSSTFFQNTAPSASTVTVGTSNDTNGDGDTMTYIALANSGPYRFGEVTSNGTSGDDFIVNVDGFPQAKFVKKHDQVEGWYFSAYAIDGHNPTKYMNLDSTIAPATDVAYDHLATGFKSRDTTTSTRGSGHSLVWGAFGITPLASNNRAR